MNILRPIHATQLRSTIRVNLESNSVQPASLARTPTVPTVWGPLVLIALGLSVIPLDGPIRQFVYSFKVGGDVKRELELLQQFGDLATTVLAMIVVILLDPGSKLEKSRRLFDWALAFGLVSGVAHLLKVFIGRPRPVFNDPAYVTGPIGRYPVQLKDGSVGLIRSWDYGSGATSDLWSMPSSHAAAAACMGTVLAIFYPKLRWLCVALVAITCLARVLLRAHYPSDVLIGCGIGWWVASLAMTAQWGSRLVRLNRAEASNPSLGVAESGPAAP